jgi:hypothetical protein
MTGGDIAQISPRCLTHCRVGNFQQKNYSAEDGIDGTIGLLRRNSAAVPRNRKLSEFRSESFRRGEKARNSVPHGPRIEANSRNFVPNHSTEEKSTRNSVPWNKKKKQTLGIPFRSMSRTKTCCQFCLREEDFLSN